MLRDLWLQLPVSPAAASVSSVKGKEVRGKLAWTQISAERRRRQAFIWGEEALGKFNLLTNRKRTSPSAEQDLVGVKGEMRVLGAAVKGGASSTHCPVPPKAHMHTARSSWVAVRRRIRIFPTRLTPRLLHPGLGELRSHHSPSATLSLPTRPVATTSRASLGSLRSDIFHRFWSLSCYDPSLEAGLEFLACSS